MADELYAVVFTVGSGERSDESLEFGTAAENWGWLGLVASERGVRLLTLPRRTREAALSAVRHDYPDAMLVEQTADGLQVAGSRLSAAGEPTGGIEGILIDAQRQVQAYLQGTLREFTVPLDLRGNTSFALTVWAIASRIPYAQTRTYGWIARQVSGGGQGIYQAVGAALASNPIPLIIPCHRVVASDGSLHGYAGGLEMKARGCWPSKQARRGCSSSARLRGTRAGMRRRPVNTMRIAVFGDIHGNLFSLQAVLADLRAQRPDALVVTGDLVYKLPWGAEVVDLLRSIPCECILGNAELYVALWDTPLWPGHWSMPLAQQVVQWEVERLGRERVDVAGRTARVRFVLRGPGG